MSKGVDYRKLAVDKAGGIDRHVPNHVHFGIYVPVYDGGADPTDSGVHPRVL